MSEVGWIGTSHGGSSIGHPDPQKLVLIGLKPRVNMRKLRMVVIREIVI